MKTIERVVRNWFNRRYRKNREPLVVDSANDVLHLADNAKILFLRQDRLGDVLITTPVLKAVREKYPNARIDVVLSRNNIAVANAVAPFTDHRYVYQKTLRSLVEIIAQIRKVKYDVVVDLLDNASSTSSILTTASGAAQAVGIQKENSGSYSVVVPLKDRSTVHISERIAQLLMPFGIDPNTIDLRPIYELDKRSHDTSKCIGVNISGSTDARSMSVHKVCTFIEHIHRVAPDLMVYVFCAPRHAARLHEIGKRLPNCGVVEPTSSFHEYATMLHEMDALITPDTSAVHLAAAWNMPCCVLFNKDVENRLPWYPYNTHCDYVISPGTSIDDCTDSDIVEAIDRLLAYCAFPVE